MFSFSRHPLSAGRLARLAGAALLIAGISLHPAATQAAGGSFTNRAFTVVSVNSTAVTPSFVVQRSWTGPEITVDLAAGATIVRRFDGKSNLNELSTGDHVQISGSNLGNNTISATSVQDNSIQVGHTQINAVVSYVARDFSQMAVRVTANEGVDAAFGVGATIMVDITSSTPVTFLNGQVGTVQQLRPGMVITLYGFSDREGQLVLSPHGITQILAGQAGALTRVAPDDNAAK